MTAKDRYGLELTGASPAAAELYQQALDAYHCYAGEPFPLLQAAIADSPGFVMAHVLKGYMTLVGSNPKVAAIGHAAHTAARDLPASEREAGHVTAVGALRDGRIRDAGRILEDVAIGWPHDVLALQAGQLVDFMTGDSRMLRDRIGRVRAAWTPDMPAYHAILGMHAFGLEETGLYDRAEAAGREAIALEPRNNWAQHAVAHVLEMQDRRVEGIDWMRADAETWSRQSFFAVHNYWHLALFHLGLDQFDAAFALYDGPIWGEQSNLAFDMVDAAALLWRLSLKGADVGGRWTALPDAFAGLPRGRYAFEDVHAVMAFVGDGRDAAAETALAEMTQALDGPADNAMFTRDVGLPVAQALAAFGRGRYAGAIELLRDVRHRAGRFGGSHAQRDLLDLTLIAAAQRAGDASLERALLAERAQAIPAVA